MKKTLSALMLALLLAGCATTQTTNSGVVGVERKQYVGWYLKKKPCSNPLSPINRP